jgi:hypothetical protein
MKDYEDEAFDDIEKAQQRKVAHGVTDGSLWRKRQLQKLTRDDTEHGKLYYLADEVDEYIQQQEKNT